MRVGILIISDRGFQGQREDKSGPAIKAMLGSLSAEVVSYDLVPDEREIIAQRLREWVDQMGLDLILTSGGTGLSPRDVTPEATLSVIDREVPGFGEAMRARSLKETPHAMLSRAVAGLRGRSLIINLPGSPKAVKECLEAILSALPHAVETARGEAKE